MISLPSATDELTEFISDLHRIGFNIGTEQYVSAHRLLLTLVAETDSPFDPQQLGLMLSPVLCTRPEEQDSFVEHYDRWLKTEPAIFRAADDTVPAETSPPKIIPRPEIKHRLFSWLRRRLFVNILFGVFMLLFVLVGIIYIFMNISVSLPTPVITAPDGNGSKIPGWEIAKWIGLVVGGIIVIGGALLWLFRFRVRLELKKLRSSATQRVDELKVKGASDQLIRFLPLRRIAQGLRRYRPFEASDLDVPKTIEETIRGGSFTPAFTSRKALPEYLVLIDRATFADQHAQLIANIVAHLGNNDVLIDQYFFREDPRTCWKEGREAQFVTLEELASRHPRHYLLIFSDGDGFFDPLVGRPYRWLETFTTWPTRLLLTSEVQGGDYRDWILAELGFRVLPATRSGLIAISESIDGGQPRQNVNSQGDPLPAALRERTGYWLKTYPPSPDLINQLCSELKSFLGAEGYYWLTACAVYPALYLDLTLYLGVKLNLQERLFDTCSQLVRLPWFRSGSMPDWLRARLAMELDAKSDQTIRVILEDLLIDSPKQQDGFVMPVVTTPAKSNEVPSGWSRLKAKARALLRTKVAEEILRKQLEENSQRDYVALAFMSGRKPSNLAVMLPRELYPVLFGADAPMITPAAGRTIVTVNALLSTILVVPLLGGSPVSILIGVVVWIAFVGLTIWSVKELTRSGPLPSSSGLSYPELLRESAGAATRNTSRWIRRRFTRNQETDVQRTGTSKTIVDPSTMEPLGTIAVAKEPLDSASDVERAPDTTKLRPPIEDFVGREKEIQTLVQALTSGRNAVITGISGMGGIGKSALALSVAARLHDQYPDGQIQVEMGGSTNAPRDPAEAIRICIRALTGVEERLVDELTELVQIYRTALEGKRVLILLDNASDADQVRELTPPPGSALLITSRNSISLPGVVQFRLGTLSHSEARQLLTEIAPHVPDDIADEICDLCGYLPLAVRVAAGTLVTNPELSPSDYVAQLRNDLRILESSGEDTNPDVEASLNLSYQQLEPETARVFRQLSIFPASFGAGAEEAIFEDKGQRQLGRLVRMGLVNYDRDTNRYHLHDLARTFSDAREIRTERVQAAERHAIYYYDVLRRAEDLYLKGGPFITGALRIFDSEWQNIWAGWSWAQRELRNNSVALQLANDYPLAAENLLDLRQPPRERILWAETGLQAVRQLRNRRATSYHLGNLGMSLVHLGELIRATEYFERQLAVARELIDLPVQGSALGNMGTAFLSRGETERAIEFFQQSLAIAREQENPREEGIALNHLGTSYFNLGEHLRAIDYHEQSLVLAKTIGARRGEGKVLNNLGMSYAALGETKLAIEYYEDSLSITRELRDRQVEGDVLFNLSVAHEQLGDSRLALPLAERALKIFEQLESPQAAVVRTQISKWRDSE